MKVSEHFLYPKNNGAIADSDAEGTGIGFVCGTVLRFFLELSDSGTIVDAKYSTNACGFAIAAAEILAGSIREKHLTDLHGLDDDRLLHRIEAELGAFSEDRGHCSRMCIEALQNAFAQYRLAKLEEFRGEKPLICTCFGISEESVEACIEQNALQTVDQVSEMCRAGQGCGSCRMLIQEIIDSRN